MEPKVMRHPVAGRGSDGIRESPDSSEHGTAETPEVDGSVAPDRGVLPMRETEGVAGHTERRSNAARTGGTSEATSTKVIFAVSEQTRRQPQLLLGGGYPREEYHVNRQVTFLLRGLAASI
jgi:hypothetical protein